jgi:predicted dehydrogenase
MARLNRRDFLTNAGAAGAGYWIAGRQPAWAQEKGPNAKLNVACIGVGGRGRASYDACKGENIVAVVDCDDRPLDACMKDTPKAKRYNDYRRMFDEMAGTIDAVTVGTPDHHHGPAGARALALKKHLYVEKPMAHNIYECRKMTELAAKNGVATQMGNQGHSSDSRRRLVEALQQNIIGDVVEVHAWTNRPIWPQGIGRPTKEEAVPPWLHWDEFLGPAPERPYSAAYHPFKWRGWWDFGTGALGDMACHIMDATYWGLNLGFPKTVEVESDGPAGPETAPKWEIIRFEFPARGTLPALKYTWYDGGKMPPLDLAGGLKLNSNGNIIVGRKGTIVVLDEQGGGWKVVTDGKPVDNKELDVKQTLPRVPGGMNGHHGEWLTACKGGPKAQGDLSYSGPFTEMVLIGIAAYRTGKRFEWDGPAMKATNAPEADRYIKRDYRKGWEI